MPDIDDGGFFRNETRSDFLPPPPYPQFCEADPEGPFVEDVHEENEKKRVWCPCPACTAYREFLDEVAEEEGLYPDGSDQWLEDE